MDKVIKIILSILGALLLFLAGWFAKAWENRGKVTKEVKQAMTDLNNEHKKALKALLNDHEKKMRKKDEIITRLLQIIERLINTSSVLPHNNVVDKLLRNLAMNKNKLHKLKN